MTRLTVRGAATPELLLRIINILHQRDIEMRSVEARFTEDECTVTADINSDGINAFDVLVERMRGLVLVGSVAVQHEHIVA
ncbi:hypothetical protein [Sphingomonas sp. NFX23]|uniref:hypothetical protein n=1 Tax=Sphingomonas sp. NFX23 TaxID=2819532 RepID=UPI003CF5D411